MKHVMFAAMVVAALSINVVGSPTSTRLTAGGPTDPTPTCPPDHPKPCTQSPNLALIPPPRSAGSDMRGSHLRAVA